MRVLYLDTSSKYLSLAVADGGRILSRMHRPLDRRHSLQLVPLINKILTKIKLPLKKLDGFCVGRGPGSFTGLRIGITTVKGLAFVLAKPVVAIPSLDILAQNIRKIKAVTPLPAQVCVLVDARQNKVYACLYNAQNGKIRRRSRYLLLPVEELLKELKGKVLFLGDGVAIYREKLSKNKKIKAIFAEERFWYPEAQQAVALALERFKKRKFEDVNSLVPLYLYPKECQIKRKGKR